MAAVGTVLAAVGDAIGLGELFKKPPKASVATPAAVDTIPGSPLDIIGNGGGGGNALGVGGGGSSPVLNQVLGPGIADLQGLLAGAKPGGMPASPAAATGPAGVGSGGKGIAPPAQIGGGSDFSALPWLQGGQVGASPGTPGAIM